MTKLHRSKRGAWLVYKEERLVAVELSGFHAGETIAEWESRGYRVEVVDNAEAIARWKLEVGAPAHRPDNCDECGREMPLTGDQLCRSCYEDEERRSRCIVCGERKVWLDEACCSDACDQIYAGWPEP